MAKKVTPATPAPEASDPEKFGSGISEPFAGTLSLSQLPDPRNKEQNANLRSVPVKDGESYSQAVVRDLKADTLANDLLLSSGALLPLYVAEWDAVPDFLRAKGYTWRDSTSGVCRAIADGNRRATARRINAEAFPQGKEVTVFSNGVESKVLRTFDAPLPVYVFRNLAEGDFLALQLASANRLPFRTGDVLAAGIRIILESPVRRGLEDAVLREIGSANLAQISTAKDLRTAVYQVLRRAALMTRDVRELYIAKKNNVPGVAHPTDSDLRDLIQHFQSEILDFSNGQITRGPLFPAGFDFRADKAEDLIRLMSEAGLDPSKSEFLSKWLSMRGKPRAQAEKSGTVKGQKDLKEMEASFGSTDAPVLAEMTGMIRGRPDAAPDKLVIDFAIDFERTSWKVLKAKEPEEYNRLKAKEAALNASKPKQK